MYIPSHLKLLVVDGAIARVDFNIYLAKCLLELSKESGSWITKNEIKWS